MTELDHIEALVGPLEKGREYRVKFGPGSFGRAMAYIPGDVGQQQTSIAEYADAALAEAYNHIADLGKKVDALYEQVKMYGAANGELKDRLAKAEAEAEAHHRTAMTCLKARRIERTLKRRAEAQVRGLATAAKTGIVAGNRVIELEDEVERLREIVDAARRGSCDMSDGCPPNHGGLYPDVKFCEGCTLGTLLARYEKEHGGSGQDGPRAR